MPLAPWALRLCWGSPVPETHSPRVLLRGEAGMGARRPSAPSPQPCPLSQLVRSAPRPHRTDGPKRASGCCILQRETLPAANHIPYLPWLMKAAQAVFAPGPALSIGQSGAGLPLAPWALMLCWGSPAPETHSKWVLLRGEAGLGARRPSVPSPQPCPPASSANQLRGPVAPAAQNELLGAAFCKGKLSSSSKPHPLSALAQESSASPFRPRPCALHRAKRG